ncbi:hypothetical protein BX666DRAFT_636445 [Dichotomocladium elegans]|nr:hypothetical protein BX666DRAFT_636445 [Dichotomocladium elegans]
MDPSAKNSKRLYIGNLHHTVDEYAIVKLFEPFGKISFLDYLFHWSGPKKGQPRGYCFLEYEKVEHAVNAINSMHQKVIKGRPLIVSFAYMTAEQQEEVRGKKHTTSSNFNRPNAMTLLRSQKMANASTDAKIQAIERKLAALQRRVPTSESETSSDRGSSTSITPFPQPAATLEDQPSPKLTSDNPPTLVDMDKAHINKLKHTTRDIASQRHRPY